VYTFFEAVYEEADEIEGESAWGFYTDHRSGYTKDSFRVQWANLLQTKMSYFQM
jgi:hypothetical protein